MWEHVKLECERYERDRRSMLQVILTELGHNRNERMEGNGQWWCWDCVETYERMIEAVNEFLGRMWLPRCMSNQFGEHRSFFLLVLSVFFFSSTIIADLMAWFRRDHEPYVASKSKQDHHTGTVWRSCFERQVNLERGTNSQWLAPRWESRLGDIAQCAALSVRHLLVASSGTDLPRHVVQRCQTYDNYCTSTIIFARIRCTIGFIR